MHACQSYGVQRLIVAGGVASNKGLRASLKTACENEGITLTILVHLYVQIMRL